MQVKSILPVAIFIAILVALGITYRQLHVEGVRGSEFSIAASQRQSESTSGLAEVVAARTAETERISKDPSVVKRLEVTNPQKSSNDLLIQEALNPGRPADARALAVNFSLICLATNSFPALTVADLTNFNGGSKENAEITLKEIQQSRARLVEICKPWVSADLLGKLKHEKLPFLGPIGKTLKQWNGGARGQEYFQAVTQILANPNAYALQFENWLSFDLSRQLTQNYGLNENQSLYVQDSLFNEFVKNNNFRQFRILARCAQSAICTSNARLTEADLSRASAVEMQIQVAMRQQRWDQLIPQ